MTLAVAVWLFFMGLGLGLQLVGPSRGWWKKPLIGLTVAFACFTIGELLWLVLQ